MGKMKTSLSLMHRRRKLMFWSWWTGLLMPMPMMMISPHHTMTLIMLLLMLDSYICWCWLGQSNPLLSCRAQLLRQAGKGADAIKWAVVNEVTEDAFVDGVPSKTPQFRFSSWSNDGFGCQGMLISKIFGDLLPGGREETLEKL
jgi:hypothetical protein